METAKRWTYLYFRNGTGKYYYYFINEIEYVNDHTVELNIELDVLQTYLFDFQMLPSFVERQHAITDTAGDNTIDEGLELGELYDNKVTDWATLNNLCIMVLCTINPNYVGEIIGNVPALGGFYNDVFSGLGCYAVDPSKLREWGDTLDDMSTEGVIDSVVAMWMYPKALVKLGGEDTWDSDVTAHYVSRAKVGETEIHLNKPTKLDGYTPRNKKLLTFPYNMLYASNNSGGSAVYHWERFEMPDAIFNTAGSVSPDGTVKMYPTSYNGLKTTDDNGLPAWEINYDQGLTLGGFPSCAWDADIYKMWLAQNGNQHGFAYSTGILKAVAGAGSAVVSAFSGNIMGAVGGGVSAVSGGLQIGELLAQKKDMEITPPQARGNFSANVNVSVGKHTFSFIHKSITAERARIIDDYFDMYGYKVNRVMIPNLKARKAWTYIKTVGCNIAGDICNEDRTKITSIFDRGITWWVKGDKVADYSQDNTI
jgi:hypothetical protein